MQPELDGLVLRCFVRHSGSNGGRTHTVQPFAKQIAEHLGRRESTVRRALLRLKKIGWVEPGTRDYRGVRWSLTQLGRVAAGLERCIYLTPEQTEVWDSDSSDGERFRKEVRGREMQRGHVEVYASDGRTLDAWEVY